MVGIVKMLSATALVAGAVAQNNNNNNNQGQNQNQNNNNAAATILAPNAIQTGSFFDGEKSLGADAGQALSATDKGNFINFCAGKTLTNGLQITTGSCNGIVMGDIPNKNQMVSTVILNPQNGQTIEAGKDFNITVQVSNLAAGSFTNADATYYAAPQTLKGGVVVGHTHVTVQDLGGSLNPTQPLDPTQFAFFKGINDAGNGQGTLAAVVAGGLPAGNFRVCTLSSASNHQPVLMPVAQRGAQDDCTRFIVKGGGGTTNVAANNGAKGQDAAQTAQEAVNLGPGAIDPNASASTTASAAAAASGAAKKGQAQQGNKQGNKQGINQQQQQNQRLARLTRRRFVS